MPYQFKSERMEDGVKISLENKTLWSKFFPQKQEDIQHWILKQNTLLPVQITLKQLADNQNGDVSFFSDHLHLSHLAIAKLPTQIAKTLNLPEPPPLSLFINKEGLVGSRSFKLIADWQDHRGKRVISQRKGSFLETEMGIYRIPSPIYEALELYDRSMSTAEMLPEKELQNIHWNALANFKAFFDDQDIHTPDSLYTLSDKLKNLKIRTASAVSLQLENETNFNPILFNKDNVAPANTEDPISEESSLLTPEEQQAFANDETFGFKRSATSQNTYRLNENDFLLIDSDLTPVLDLIRKKQQSSPKERGEFCADPTKEILETLKNSLKEKEIYADLSETEIEQHAEATLSSTYVETINFQDRAVELGIWVAPNIQLEKFENNWRPESFPLQLEQQNIFIPPTEISSLQAEFEQALISGQPTLIYHNQEIDVTPENFTRLNDYASIAEAQRTPTPDPKLNAPLDNEEESSENLTSNLNHPSIKTHSVLLNENFETTEFDAKRTPRFSPIGHITPKNIKSDLLPHQKESLDWAIDAWTYGHAGILNADDQGLGKTLQTLSFISWLQETMAATTPDKRFPILIVAPTSLLRNWEAEVETHLDEKSLGFLTRVYGSDLQQLKKYGRKLKDTESNDANLNFQHILEDIKRGKGHKHWVVTTYQTLANYLFSFREIPFAAIVFDEIQSIKNPKAFKTHQARALQGDFRIGLTGTPIENSIADLWTILDTLSPNCLGSLKEFLKKYQDLDTANLDQLYAFLFNAAKTRPALVLRRMKEEVLEGLPEKFYQLHRRTMPVAQKERYDEINSKLSEIKPANALAELNHIRSISLHPHKHNFIEDVEEFTAQSARFQCLFDILTEIHTAQERALIFLEDRDMQYVVQTLIQSKFGLETVHIINGQTPITKRQHYVDLFQTHLQEDNGFDVLILAPRAAGVGLTITAATHVIHLSRWWNPAVEEQCNDRIYRIGQKHDVTIHIPLAIHPTYQQHSFDCVLNDLMIRKKSISSNVLHPPEINDQDNDFLTKGLFTESSTIPAFKSLNDLVQWSTHQLNSSSQWITSLMDSTENHLIFTSKFKKNKKGFLFILYQETPTAPIPSVQIKAIIEKLKYASRAQRLNSYILTNSTNSDFLKSHPDLNIPRRNLVMWADLPLWPQHILAG